MAITNWIDFWNTQEVFGDTFLYKNLELFVERTCALLGYSTEDIVLDIGCGPGHLVELLKHRFKALCGVDTSIRYVSRCRQRYAGMPHLRFEHIDGGYYCLPRPFTGAQYDLIICQSLLQYLSDFDEVERLIEAIAAVAAPGARLLISDLPTSQQLYPDVASQLWHGVTRGFLTEVLHGLVGARSSDYHRLLRSPGLLTFPRRRLEALAKRLDLNATIVESGLTVNLSRIHLLVRF